MKPKIIRVEFYFYAECEDETYIDRAARSVTAELHIALGGDQGLHAIAKSHNLKYTTRSYEIQNVKQSNIGR